MHRRDIVSRLASGERFVLDGGTGSELQRRGVNVSRGVTSEGGLGPWSATAIGDAPEVVRQVHEDYLRAGADIVTTNSFWTDRVRLGMVGLSHKSEEYTRKAAELAREARDKINPGAFVAGSIAPPGSYHLGEIFAEQARTLADAGVDIILFEYVGRIPDFVAAARAGAKVGMPVFLGVRHVTPEGTMQYGDSFADLASALKGLKVDAVLTMCSAPEAISASLPRLRDAFDGAVGAYANIGYKRAPQPPSYPERQWHIIDTGEYTPQRYVQFAQEWLQMGAQIVGGCCATTPEHIAAIAPVVKAWPTLTREPRQIQGTAD